MLFPPAAGGRKQRHPAPQANNAIPRMDKAQVDRIRGCPHEQPHPASKVNNAIMPLDKASTD
jgi:hypothetical protein